MMQSRPKRWNCCKKNDEKTVNLINFNHNTKPHKILLKKGHQMRKYILSFPTLKNTKYQDIF